MRRPCVTCGSVFLPFCNVENNYYHGNLGFLSWNIIEKSLQFFEARLWESCLGKMGKFFHHIKKNIFFHIDDLFGLCLNIIQIPLKIVKPIFSKVTTGYNYIYSLLYIFPHILVKTDPWLPWLLHIYWRYVWLTQRCIYSRLFNSVPAWKGSKRLLGRVLNEQCDGFDKSWTVRGNRGGIYLSYSQYFTNWSTTNWFIFCYWPFTEDTGSVKCDTSKF